MRTRLAFPLLMAVLFSASAAVAQTTQPGHTHPNPYPTGNYPSPRPYPSTHPYPYPTVRPYPSGRPHPYPSGHSHGNGYRPGYNGNQYVPVINVDPSMLHTQTPAPVPGKNKVKQSTSGQPTPEVFKKVGN